MARSVSSIDRYEPCTLDRSRTQRSRPSIKTHPERSFDRDQQIESIDDDELAFQVTDRYASTRPMRFALVRTSRAGYWQPLTICQRELIAD